MAHKTKAQLVQENQALTAQILDLQARLSELDPSGSPTQPRHARLEPIAEMASSLIHELNQPLGAVLTYSRASIQLLKIKQADTDDLLHALHQIIAQAERASEVVARLRRFVVPRKAQRALVRIGDLVRKALALCEAEIRRQQVKTKVDIDDTSPPLLVERFEIEEVILNLIRNALDAMVDTPAQDRHLRIAARLNEHGALQLDVSDAGCGLSVELVQRLFQPFQTTKPHGMGMGLALSRSMIQAHGGSLWAKPNPEGGTTFSFALPLVHGDKENGQNALRLPGR
jgi:two-component system, LuxR family, sensor kinase FixL